MRINIFFFAHTHQNQLSISIEEICNYRATSHNKDYHQDFIEIILSRAKNNTNNGNWGPYRNDLFALSIVYRDMKEYLIQSVLLLNVCYYDYQGTLKSFVEQFILEVSKYLKNNIFTIAELEKCFFNYSFDLFPCKVDKQTIFNLICDEINKLIDI